LDEAATMQRGFEGDKDGLEGSGFKIKPTDQLAALEEEEALEDEKQAEIEK
jgi:hypothetical protein